MCVGENLVAELIDKQLYLSINIQYSICYSYNTIYIVKSVSAESDDLPAGKRRKKQWQRLFPWKKQLICLQIIVV